MTKTISTWKGLSCPILGDESAPLDLPSLDLELGLRLKEMQESTGELVIRARMSTLVVYCASEELADNVRDILMDILGIHPARVILLIGSPDADHKDLTTTVRVCIHPLRSDQVICSEVITIRASGAPVQHMPFVVRSILLGDLPTNLWWATPQAPPMGGLLFHELAEDAEQVLFDSVGWPDPARGMLAITSWVAQLERTPHAQRWRLAADLNWRRLKYWRRLLTQALDPASSPGILEGIEEIILEHGPHAVTKAWLLLSWLVSRLNWRVQIGRVKQGEEMVWQCESSQRKIRLRIRRLPQGDPKIYRLQINSGAGPLDFQMEDERRLAVIPESGNQARRTVTVPPTPLAELVGRELSDRDRDPVFQDSLQIARVLAQSVLS